MHTLTARNIYYNLIKIFWIPWITDLKRPFRRGDKPRNATFRFVIFFHQCFVGNDKSTFKHATWSGILFKQFRVFIFIFKIAFPSQWLQRPYIFIRFNQFSWKIDHIVVTRPYFKTLLYRHWETVTWVDYADNFIGVGVNRSKWNLIEMCIWIKGKHLFLSNLVQFK